MTQGSLAEKLRVLRAREGLSLTEAAARAGVTRDTLSDLEHGKRQPYMPTLSKIAAGYDVPVEDLLEEPVLAGKAEAPQETGRRGPDMEGITKAIGDLRRTTRRYETSVLVRFYGFLEGLEPLDKFQLLPGLQLYRDGPEVDV